MILEDTDAIPPMVVWLHHRGPLHIPLWCNSINFNLTGNANGNTKLMPWVNESFAFTHCI